MGIGVHFRGRKPLHSRLRQLSLLRGLRIARHFHQGDVPCDGGNLVGRAARLRKSAGSGLPQAVGHAALRQTGLVDLHRRGGDSSGNIHNMAYMLLPIAKHHAKLLDDEVQRLRVPYRRLKIERQGMTKKNRERLSQFDNAHNLNRLPLLPGELLKIAQEKIPSPKRAASLVEIALAIEVLRLTSLRIKNVAALRSSRVGRRSTTVRPDVAARSHQQECASSDLGSRAYCLQSVKRPKSSAIRACPPNFKTLTYRLPRPPALFANHAASSTCRHLRQARQQRGRRIRRDAVATHRGRAVAGQDRSQTRMLLIDDGQTARRAEDDARL